MISSTTRLLSLVLAAGLSTSALAVEGDWGQVAQALGKSGSGSFLQHGSLCDSYRCLGDGDSSLGHTVS
jgi:hypothetical protein